jgi:hypothetical protein
LVFNGYSINHFFLLIYKYKPHINKILEEKDQIAINYTIKSITTLTQEKGKSIESFFHVQAIHVISSLVTKAPNTTNVSIHTQSALKETIIALQDLILLVQVMRQKVMKRIEKIIVKVDTIPYMLVKSIKMDNTLSCEN